MNLLQRWTIACLKLNRVDTVFKRQYSLPLNILQELQTIVGEKNISTSEAVREHHGKDEGPFKPCLADAVIFPKSTEEVSKIAQICHSNNLPMIPYGTGTGLEGGINALKGGLCIDLNQMDNILQFNQENFNVIVQPGVTRKMLNSYLKNSGLWFPVDPGADASLCGMAATSASGTNAVRYGTMRDNVFNLEVVLADGSIIHTSGKGRCTRKTAAGYNLTNLFVGSEGTLGIITSATLNLFAIPDTMLAAVCNFPAVHDAVKATQDILLSNIPIAKIEFLDEIAIKACNMYSKLSFEETPVLFMEFHGNDVEVEKQAAAVGEIISEHNGSKFQWARETEARNQLWKARHELYYACLGLQPGYKCITTDVCVPISNLPEMIMGAKEDITQSGIIGPILGHVGDGNFHSLLLFDPNKENDYQKAKSVANKLVKRALKLNGTCTGEHGVGQGKIQSLIEEVGPNTIRTMKMIKNALDPKGLMNPGKVLNM